MKVCAKLYKNVDFRGCMDRILDITDLYKEIVYQRMSDKELQDFVTQTLVTQQQIQATLLSTKYIQGVRVERRSKHK